MTQPNPNASAFLAEVAGQPRALRDLVGFYRAEGRERLARWAGMAREWGRVVFSGMGTSLFAPELVVARLAANGVDASTIDAGEWCHYPRPVKALTVLVSQSGESVEIRNLLAARDDTCPLVAVTNDPASALGSAAVLVLPLLAGAETAISTKTYVNTLALLCLMADSLEGRSSLDRLARLADSMDSCDAAGIERAADLLGDAHALHFVSRGPGLVAAKQAALTFMEGARTASSAFSGGAFRHGPLEVVDSTHRSVFFVPQGGTAGMLRSMVGELADRGSRVVVISDAELGQVEAKACLLRVPPHGEDLFCLSAATTQELLLDAVARRKGLVAGLFRYGSKVTTRE